MRDTQGAWVRGPSYWLLLVMALILTGWALKAASSVVVPFVVAFFLAIALAPLDALVHDRAPRGTRWMGHLVSMLILLVLLGAFFAGIGLAAQQVAEKFPGSLSDMGDVIEQTATPSDAGNSASGSAGQGQGTDSGGGKAPPAEGSGDGGGGDTSGAAGQGEAGAGETSAANAQSEGGGVFGRLQGWKGELGELLKERSAGYAGTILNRMASFLASLVLVLFLTLLLLIEAPNWREKARTVFTREEESQWMRALEQTARALRVFVIAKSAVGLATALLYVGWMAVMGLDLLLVWGVLTFLLSFVPVIGSVVSGLIAAGYAFFQLDIYWAVVTAVGLLAIEQVMGNYIEPRFLGRQLSLSSFVVLASLLLWGWLWGIAGALLATPLLILLLNVSAHVGSLRPLAVLLSENGEESVRAVHADEKA